MNTHRTQIGFRLAILLLALALLVHPASAQTTAWHSPGLNPQG